MGNAAPESCFFLLMDSLFLKTFSFPYAVTVEIDRLRNTLEQVKPKVASAVVASAAEAKGAGKRTGLLCYLFNFQTGKTQHLLSERLVSLGIMGAQLRAPLKSLNTIVF